MPTRCALFVLAWTFGCGGKPDGAPDAGSGGDTTGGAVAGRDSGAGAADRGTSSGADGGGRAGEDVAVATAGSAARPEGGMGATPDVPATGGGSADPPGATSGLRFVANGASGSDVRLVWSGVDLLPRVGHTAIWQAMYSKQPGYYAVTWHSHNDATWHASLYEYGAHPYPCDGTVLPSGQAGNGTGSAGTVQFHEIAGLGASDFIASPSKTALELAIGTWLSQARVAYTVTVSSPNDTIRHIFYPDIVGHPSFSIQQDRPSTGLEGGSDPAFYVGCSDWTASGSANSECPDAVLRGLRLFQTALSVDDIKTEAASTTDAARTAAGASSIWYSRINPTPADTSDRSGAGHNPTWANGNRPVLWTE